MRPHFVRGRYMRADITVAFYLRVNETQADVLRVEWPNGVPQAALISGGIAGITLLLLSAAPGFVGVYAFIALVSAVAALVLYAMCSAAVLRLKMWGGGVGALIAAVALLYSIAMFFGAGWEATKWGVALALAGLPIRWLSRRLWPSPAAADAPAAPRGSAA